MIVRNFLESLRRMTLTDGDTVIWDAASGTWQAATGGGGGSLATLSDVTLTSPADTEVLTYDSGSGKWKNLPASGGGTPAGWTWDASALSGPTGSSATIELVNTVSSTTDTSGVLLTNLDFRMFLAPGFIDMGNAGETPTINLHPTTGANSYLDLYVSTSVATPLDGRMFFGITGSASHPTNTSVAMLNPDATGGTLVFDATGFQVRTWADDAFQAVTASDFIVSGSGTLKKPSLACPMGQSAAVTFTVDDAGSLTFLRGACS